MMEKPKIVASHGNGKYPCPFGCLYDEYSDGKLRLTGDCRIPWDGRCWLKQEASVKRLQEQAK